MSNIINNWSAICPKCENKILSEKQICRNCEKTNIFIEDIVGTVPERFLKCKCGSFPTIKCEKCGCTIHKESLLPPLKGASPCFVVTACYGEDHINVKLLREYRDNVLVKSTIGSLIIKIYETIGPCIANYINDKSWLKDNCKKLISLIVAALKLEK